MTLKLETSVLPAESGPHLPDDRGDVYLVRSFSAHLAQYIGIGLISGSVVHAGTLGGSSLKYGVLIGFGMLFYCLKFLIEAQFRIDRQMFRFLSVSTLVALGTGMLSGSVQHFLDGPRAGAVLASVGVVIAYPAFCLREDRRALTWRSVSAVLLFGVALFSGLWVAAGFLGGTGHDGH